MKIGIISDTHGSATAWSMAYEKYLMHTEQILHAGDVLYHGPRNQISDGYGPSRLAAELNACPVPILAARGNCDSEVDQLLLEFPMMADYAELDADGERFFLTHGHHWNEYALPPVGMGTILAHGHTHIAEKKKLPCGITIFNPGSIALPKGGQGRTFGSWDCHYLYHYLI